MHRHAQAPDPERIVPVMAEEATLPWADALQVGPRVDPGLADAELTRALEPADVVLLDGGDEAPLSLVRRLRRLVPEVQPVLVAEPSRVTELKRAVLFTPGVGELWIVPPDALDHSLLERAAAVGRQHRTHARRAAKVSARVASLETRRERPLLTDEFLATLLEVLPEPTFALDEQAAIVFANPAARTAFGLEPDEPREGDSFVERVETEAPDALARLLREGKERVARGQFTLRPGGGEGRVYDVTVAPVPGNRPTRALVLHEVTAEVEARESLQQALADLRMAMEHRSRFYASMSHELRTPVNAIMGYNALLLDEIYGAMAPEQRDPLQRIAIAARHLLDLVNDVLDLSKIESGKIALQPVGVAVGETLLDLAATMEPLAREHETRIEFDVDECGEPFQTDPRRLRQILLNLLSNAIRYSEGKPVKVRCERVEQSLRIDVSDQGPGIPTERLDEIFDEFVQLGEKEARSGTGLGLAIARTLARALGGELTATSELGRGSTFTVTIPPLEGATESG